MSKNFSRTLSKHILIFLCIGSMIGVCFEVITSNTIHNEIIINSKNPIKTTGTIEEDIPLVIKILCYNIQDSGRDPRFLDVLKEENADIIMLDETSEFGESNYALLKQVVKSLNNYFVDEDPYTGKTFLWCDETIISRFPIVDVKLVKPLILDNGEEYDFYRDPLDAVVKVRDTDIHLIGVHFKCCGDIRKPGECREATTRENTMESVINYMDDLGDVPIIYLGDFNCYNPIDIGILAPKVMNLGDEPIDMLLNETNPHASEVHSWIDTFRELNPYDPGYTYDIDPYGSRIDYIFVNQFFDTNLINATVGDTASAKVGSDHYSLDLWLNMDPTVINLRFPRQVTGLNGSIISPTGVNITWAPNEEENISHYFVYRDKLRIANITENFYVDNTLIAGQNYRYTVGAIDTSRYKGLNSRHIFVNTSYGVVTTTVSPELKGNARDQEVTLTWEMPKQYILPQIQGFSIYEEIQNNSGTFFSLIADIPSDNRSYTLINLVNGQEYSFRVTAISELGESSMSNRVTLKPSAPEPSTSTTSSITTTQTTTTSTNERTPGFDFIIGIAAVLALVIGLTLRKKH
ncbi:MAG: fibronectin type III domain-containing protein [Promethearchaeota archaeon]